jgi:hypothetical protein
MSTTSIKPTIEIVEPLGVEIDCTGRLAGLGRDIQLTRRERQLVPALIDRWPKPVPAQEAGRLLWPNRYRSDTIRHSTMTGLRRRLTVVGLALRCRTGVGYTLERSPWTIDGSAPPTHGASG